MAVGIIAEYNPFHKGHAYQIAEVRKIFSDAEIVAVMSGSFTQRGEPAILDKWTRARLAVMGGCDLVLELPFTSAVRSAQDFARGGIRLLNKLSVIDVLAFGAEFSDLKKLQAAAKIFSEKFFAEKIRGEMSCGISYASAVSKILSQFSGVDEKILSQSNTILAIEYLRALPEKIMPLLIPRIGAAYSEKNLRENFSSAAAIRAAVREKNPAWEKISASTDKNVLAELQTEKNFGFVREEFLLPLILFKLRTCTLDDLRKIYGVNEGLEFRLIDAARSAENFSDFVKKIVSRRYQTSRVKRLLLYILLGVTAEKIFELDSADFVRVLAFNERGRKLLKKIKSVSDLPIVTKVSQHLTSRDILEGRLTEPYKKNLALDILSTDLRGLLFSPQKNSRQDFLTSPEIFKR